MRQVFGSIGLIVITLFVVLVHGAFGQTELATGEQCRADAQLWLEESGWNTGYYYKVRQNLRSLTVRQLVERKQHMVNCSSVDRESTDSYLRVNDVYDLEIGERYANFIVRHELAGQFYKEDEAGFR